MKDKLLLGVGLLLVIFSVVKPDLSSLSLGSNSCVIDVVVEQVDKETQQQLQPIIDSFKNGPTDRKYDGKRLASLYMDIASLIKLDGEDQIVKNTEEVRQANSMSGRLLKMNIRDKYPNLSTELTKYLVSIIGDDHVQLDDSLREKTSQAFKALAWACNEGSK